MAAIVRAVLDAGGQPVVADLRHPQVEGVDHELVDLADGRAAERAVRTLADRAGGLDAIVTAAGTDACGLLSDVPAEVWEKVVAVNLLGTAAVVRAALPFLERSNGKIVTVASTLGLRPLSDATAYSASNAYCSTPAPPAPPAAGRPTAGPRWRAPRPAPAIRWSSPGGPDEVTLASDVAAGAGLPPSSVLAGGTSVLELAAIVAAAGTVVCGDTGVAHLATALGRPSVVLFGPVSPHLWGPPPDRPQHIALWAGRSGRPPRPQRRPRPPGDQRG